MPKHCALCGSPVSPVSRVAGLILCPGCQESAPRFQGHPVFPVVPDTCPHCHQGTLETGYGIEDDDSDMYDLKLALEIYNGELPRDVHGLVIYEERFHYIYLQALCDKCDESIYYGQKVYYNAETNWWDAPKPLTPREQAAQEVREQEAAGQMRLF